MKQIVNDSIDLLRKMIAIPSPSFQEDGVCSLIQDTLHSWGIDCQRIGNNLIARNLHYNPAKPSLALDAHIDTVPASSGYTRDPLDPGTEPDTIYGLGSNDDGGSVVSLIAVFRHFYSADNLPANLLLTLNCEEEKCGPDGDTLLYSADGPLADILPQWAIVGEPTGMRAAISEHGLLVLDGHATGVSGHAARNEGVNALYIALDDIKALREHKFTKTSPIMGDVKLNVTQIQAGSAHNVIPDGCDFVVDIRPTEQYANIEILEELQALCKSTLKARNLTNRSSATPKDSILIRTAEQLGVQTFASPTTSNWMKMNCEAIKMGPGDSARSHHADEYILRSEIEGAVDGYIKFIEQLYGNIME